MIAAVEAAPKDQWQRIQLGKNIRRKYRNLLVLESTIKLKNYDSTLRQLVVKNNGRKQPAFIVTNDFDISIKQAVLKYAHRWLVEQAISQAALFTICSKIGDQSSIVGAMSNLVAYDKFAIQTVWRKIEKIWRAKD